jgi:hypothetical protein
MRLPEQHAQHTYTRPARQERSRPAPPLLADEEDEEEAVLEEDDEEEMLFPARVPRSAIRYQPTRAVMEQAPLAVAIYRTHRRTQTAEHAPSSPQRSPVPPRPARRGPRMHPLFYVGLSMCIMLLGWVALSFFLQWWQVTQDDWHYGRPRTFQIDAVVGHGDSPAHPSHFIALNLNRHIEIIEIPGGDATHMRVYLGPLLMGEGKELAVVTLSFKDVNGDGLPDMLVRVQDSTIVFLNDHGQFRPLRAGEQITI